jgi:hypothetical protein
MDMNEKKISGMSKRKMSSGLSWLSSDRICQPVWPSAFIKAEHRGSPSSPGTGGMDEERQQAIDTLKAQPSRTPRILPHGLNWAISTLTATWRTRPSPPMRRRWLSNLKTPMSGRIWVSCTDEAATGKGGGCI